MTQRRERGPGEQLLDVALRGSASQAGGPVGLPVSVKWRRELWSCGKGVLQRTLHSVTVFCFQKVPFTLFSPALNRALL